MRAPLSAALDLGSTRIKLARLGGDGQLELLGAAPFPVLELGGLRVEIDLAAFDERVARLLALLAPGTRLGIASQRSSFVLWERSSGRPACEVLSWRDRRAANWCSARPELEAVAQRSSGLRLSPHYAGPKLAQRLESRPELRRMLERGALLFGTLESYAIWRATSGRVHVTDSTMAARTLLFDPRREVWSDEWIERFGARGLVLPRVVPSRALLGTTDGGLELHASLADQASGLLSVARAGEALVNLGTGCFVLGDVPRFEPRSGYLCGPVFAEAGVRRFALEGTLNGGGATLARYGDEPTELAEHDPTPELYCVPDESGVGAPHWLARGSTLFSHPALPAAELRRAWLEGLVFRLRELLDDLAAGACRVLVSGGLAREPFVAPALATVLERPVEVLEEPEATLLGAARLAAGLDPYSSPLTRSVEPVPSAHWIAEKYPRWRNWCRAVLADAAR